MLPRDDSTFHGNAAIDERASAGTAHAPAASSESPSDVGRCRHCGYDLRGQQVCRCPECGEAFDPQRTKRTRPVRPQAGLGWSLVALVASGLNSLCAVVLAIEHAQALAVNWGSGCACVAFSIQAHIVALAILLEGIAALGWGGTVFARSGQRLARTSVMIGVTFSVVAIWLPPMV